jgi:hypothetical protein
LSACYTAFRLDDVRWFGLFDSTECRAPGVSIGDERGVVPPEVSWCRALTWVTGATPMPLEQQCQFAAGDVLAAELRGGLHGSGVPGFREM